MKEGSSGGASLCEGFLEGELEGGLLTGELFFFFFFLGGHQEY